MLIGLWPGSLLIPLALTFEVSTVFEGAEKYTTWEGYTRVVYSRYMKGMYYREPCFEKDDKRREMILFEPTDLKYFDNKVVPGRARVNWEMQRFR